MAGTPGGVGRVRGLYGDVVQPPRRCIEAGITQSGKRPPALRGRNGLRHLRRIRGIEPGSCQLGRGKCFAGKRGTGEIDIERLNRVSRVVRNRHDHRTAAERHLVISRVVVTDNDRRANQGVILIAAIRRIVASFWRAPARSRLGGQLLAQAEIAPARIGAVNIGEIRLVGSRGTSRKHSVRAQIMIMKKTPSVEFGRASFGKR